MTADMRTVLDWYEGLNGDEKREFRHYLGIGKGITITQRWNEGSLSYFEVKEFLDNCGDSYRDTAKVMGHVL